MKSATTASSGTPSPVIRMPVCPVARNVAFIPRARISRSMQSAVYILPTEQSVPTARQRLPAPPLAVGDRIAVRRHPHVVQLAPVRHRRGDQLRLVAQQVVQARGEVHPVRQRLGQHVDPGRRDHPAAVRHAHHQRPRPGGGRLGGSCPAGPCRPCSPACGTGRSRRPGASRGCPAPPWPPAGRRRRRERAGRASRSSCPRSPAADSPGAVRRLKLHLRNGPSGAARTIRQCATWRSPRRSRRSRAASIRRGRRSGSRPNPSRPPGTAGTALHHSCRPPRPAARPRARPTAPLWLPAAGYCSARTKQA